MRKKRLVVSVAGLLGYDVSLYIPGSELRMYLFQLLAY